MISIFLFTFGLFIGSFLLVVIDRLPRNESIFFGRSHCDICLHTLAWYDLIPVVSFSLLGGKCRYCHKSFGLLYPIVEIVTAGVFGLIPLTFSLSTVWQYLVVLCLVSCFIVIFFTDMFFGIIPDVVVIATAIFSFLILVISQESLIVHGIVAVVTGLLFLLLYFGTKQKGIGLGDVKFAPVMGLLLGFPEIILGLYSAFLTGALIALILILGKKKHFRSDTISFGPFLVLGTYIGWIGGINLWHLFLHLVFQM